MVDSMGMWSSRLSWLSGISMNTSSSAAECVLTNLKLFICCNAGCRYRAHRENSIFILVTSPLAFVMDATGISYPMVMVRKSRFPLLFICCLQVTCFLAGLFSTGQAKSILVLAPKSVMRSWETELLRWLVKAACREAEVGQQPGEW